MKKISTSISGIERLDREAEEILSEVSDIKYVAIKNDIQLKNILNECDAFWFRLNHKLTRDILSDIRCKYILCAVTGLDHIDVDACIEFNIKIISLKGESKFLKEVRATAEHTFGLMLALIRNSKTAFAHVEDRKWNRDLFQGNELYKKNMGIFGLGRLGKIVADYAKAFGMEVYYYDISNQSYKDYIRCGSSEELFETVDMLSIHLPYHSKTHFLIDEKLLNRMKISAFIINTSRGGVINEDHLLRFLKSNKIAGYATDVIYGEPDVKNNELVAYAQGRSNVIITPHIGGNTIESISKTEIFIAEKLKTAL